MREKAYNNERGKVSFFVPQMSLIDENILLNKNGTMQKIFKYTPKDLDNLTESSLITYRNRLNNVFKRLEGGYIITIEVQRKINQEYPKKETEWEVFNVIEDEREQSFKNATFFENEYFLSILKKIPTQTESKVTSFFIDEAGFRDDIEEFLKTFQSEVKEIELLCRDLFLDFEPLSAEEVYSYLHSTVSDHSQKVKIPSTKAYICNYITDREMINGFHGRIGDKYFRCITFNDTPLYSTPNMLDELSKLKVEFRWCTRYIILDKFEAKAKIEKQKRIAMGKRHSVFESFKSRFTGNSPRITNPEAVVEADMLHAELIELDNNNLSEGYFTQNIILYGDTMEELESKVRIVNKFFIDKEFVTIIEYLQNSQAFLGSIPGNIESNMRSSLLHSFHFSHLIPTTETWTGNKKNKHLKEDALFLAKTKGTKAFYFNLHVKDVGHSMIVGKTGAGKSVLLGAIALNFMKYKNSKVIYFDKGGSQRILCYALDGIFNDIGNDNMSFQPFEKIENPSNRKKALLFLEELLSLHNIFMTPEIQSSLWETLSIMASNPVELRTFTTLATSYSGDIAVKTLFKDYTLSGSQGELFEGSINPLKENRFQVFEMEKISENPKGITLVLSYLFQEIEENLTGDPTLIILDECWKFLDNEKFSNKIKEWLKVLRKSNTSVIFATQELNDIMDSEISSTLISQAATRIFLPNSEIKEYASVYEKFGLNKTEMLNLAEAKPKREYFLKNEEGARMFELELQEQGLNFLTKSEKEEQRLGKKIYDRVGGGNPFTKAWIEAMKTKDQEEFYSSQIGNTKK